MEKRIKITHFFKSNNSKELKVFRAASSVNEIRFYFNNDDYVSAVDNHDNTYSIIYESSKSDEYISSNVTKHDLKYYLEIMLGLTFEYLLYFLSLVSILFFIRNILITFLCTAIFLFITNIIGIIIGEYLNTPKALRSKHSAEHMMVNFLNQNARLPKNMLEIKKSSRFTLNCSSRRKVPCFTKDFVYLVFSIVLALIIQTIFLHNYENDILTSIATFALCFIIGILMQKYNKLDFIVNFMKKILCFIIQCCNTTKYVSDNDIFLAYYAAREWIKIVYPEFYNSDEDIF